MLPAASSISGGASQTGGKQPLRERNKGNGVAV